MNQLLALLRPEVLGLAIEAVAVGDDLFEPRLLDQPVPEVERADEARGAGGRSLGIGRLSIREELGISCSLFPVPYYLDRIAGGGLVREAQGAIQNDPPDGGLHQEAWTAVVAVQLVV